MAVGATNHASAQREDDRAATGLREQNARDRREALVEAAYALFAEKGYAHTTMDEIAERAGLSRRTAFRYFATKEELVFPAREQRLAMLRAELAPRAGERAFETVRRACLALASHFEADRERQLAQWRILRGEPALVGRDLDFDRESEAAIEQAFLSGERDTPRARRRAKVRAAAVTGAVRATLREWLEGGATAELGKLGRETFAELEAGFAD
jgi:AcrR family transcriptional regulator